MITYTLFKWSVRRTEISSRGIWITCGEAAEDEEWKKAGKDGEKPEEYLEFVCHVKSPAEVAAVVRRDPLQRYVLFHGEMQEVKIAMPVFVDGKNLDTYSKEWES